MALFNNPAAVTAAVKARLSAISPDNGYHTTLKAVFVPSEKVSDRQALPYALIRPGTDRRSDMAGMQALRVREYVIEGVFSAAATEQEVSALHVDVLRALGVGQHFDEREFAGLLDEEDEAEFRWAERGEATHSIIIRFGVQYVQNYN